MPALPEIVRAQIETRFPPNHREEVATFLSEYGKEEHEREVERVLLDILEICDSDVGKVRRLVASVKSDYRDLIVAAEYDEVDGKLVLKKRSAKSDNVIGGGTLTRRHDHAANAWRPASLPAGTPGRRPRR